MHAAHLLPITIPRVLEKPFFSQAAYTQCSGQVFSPIPLAPFTFLVPGGHLVNSAAGHAALQDTPERICRPVPDQSTCAPATTVAGHQSRRIPFPDYSYPARSPWHTVAPCLRAIFQGTMPLLPGNSMGLGAPCESELLSLGALKDRCTSQLRCAAHDHFLPCELCDLEAESGWRCEKCGHASPARAPDGTEHACKSRAEFRRTGRIAFAEALDPAVPSPAPKPPPPGRPRCSRVDFFPPTYEMPFSSARRSEPSWAGYEYFLGQ
jgi:hypothetical protein